MLAGIEAASCAVWGLPAPEGTGNCCSGL